MASFQNKTRDEITSATIIAQLTPTKSENSPLAGSESWRCAFAPDESFFAWSSGNRIVTLVPWNRCKSTLAAIDNTDDEGQQLTHKPVTIDTGCLVHSVAFGSSTAPKCAVSFTAFWTRFSVSKDLVLATGHSNGRIRTWDVYTGKLMLELMDHKSIVSNLDFAPDGSLLLISSSHDGTLKLWDLQDDGNMCKTLKMGNSFVYSCAWAPDAKTLVSVGVCRSAYVWDMQTYKVKLKLEGHHHDIVACDFSPDGCLIATASFDTRVILWDAHTGKMLKTFGHLFPSPRLIYASGANGTFVRSLSFSKDGAHLATVADDGYLRFWDILHEDDPVAVGSVEDALSCCYSPSGRVLAVGTKTGAVSFWQATMAVKPLLFLCRITIRRLTPPESVGDLFIPKRLTNYLLYKEWE